ncbi:chloride channel protein [Paenibacillus sp. FSL K6-0276]|uniref:chloride channel protein n=1 Tax=Paenibacillus sp. FSL K6-0276 TaxID=2921450 RepID=UPI0030EF2429
MEFASFTMKTFSLIELIAFMPLVIAGMLFGALFLLCQKLVAVVFAPLATHKFARAIITGMVLGVVGMFLPYTMYSGEEQMLELVNDWQSWSIIILFITSLIKMVMINVCISGGNSTRTADHRCRLMYAVCAY